MRGQMSLPDGPKKPKAPEVCGWCPEPAVDRVEVEPPTSTKSRMGRLAPVCATHKLKILDAIRRSQ